MNLQKSHPITNGTRHQLNISKNLLSKNNRIFRSNIKGLSRSLGRSSKTGHITVWHKGGGVKRIFRKIYLSNDGYNSIVLMNLYDPFRSSFITLNFDLDRCSFFRTLSINTLSPGTLMCCNIEMKDVMLGYKTKIKNIPTGSSISSLSIKNKEKSQYIRSAGTFGVIVQKGYFTAKIRLPSNKIIEVSTESFATVGVISNPQHKFVCLGKAGRNRLLGKRPTTRGIAMNPCDHPHGGRTNGGKPSVTPWALPTKAGYYKKKRKKINVSS
jgi:large subunit ribosomal protein L2